MIIKHKVPKGRPFINRWLQPAEKSLLYGFGGKMKIRNVGMHRCAEKL